MAGKKPAKPMAGQSKQAVLDPKIYGVKVRFIGIGDAQEKCDTCGKIIKTGMIRLKEDNFYCTIKCVEKSQVLQND